MWLSNAFGRCSTAAVGAALVLTGGMGTGCDTKDSKTELRPDGPPVIMQVFVQERVTIVNDDGSMSTRTRTQLAFGDHPDVAAEDDDRVVTNALARGSQKIRVVIDELLEGSSLEEVQCADGSWSSIPAGTTPDDIDDCAGPVNEIAGSCTKVCVGAMGPIGVLDEDDDGAADQFRFKQGSVRILCGEPGDQLEMPLDLDNSFYNPSGNQQIPAGAIGLDGLGPAVVLEPIGLRTGTNCTIVFDPSVTDKSGNQVCTPAGGDPDGACTPGDTSGINFGVQPFLLLGTDPDNGAEGVATAAGQILMQFNQAVDPDTMAQGIIVEANGGPVAVTHSVDADDPTIVTTVLDAGAFAPNTTYTVNILSGPNGLKEEFGGTLAADTSFSFTTAGAAPTPDAAPPAPDADVSPDAGM